MHRSSAASAAAEATRNDSDHRPVGQEPATGMEEHQLTNADRPTTFEASLAGVPGSSPRWAAVPPKPGARAGDPTGTPLAFYAPQDAGSVTLS